MGLLESLLNNLFLRSFFFLSFLRRGARASAREICLGTTLGGGPGLGSEWAQGGLGGLAVGLQWACGGLWWAFGGLWWSSMGFDGLW